MYPSIQQEIKYLNVVSGDIYSYDELLDLADELGEDAEQWLKEREVVEVEYDFSTGEWVES